MLMKGRKKKEEKKETTQKNSTRITFIPIMYKMHNMNMTQINNHNNNPELKPFKRQKDRGGGAENFECNKAHTTMKTYIIREYLWKLHYINYLVSHSPYNKP